MTSPKLKRKAKTTMSGLTLLGQREMQIKKINNEQFKLITPTLKTSDLLTALESRFLFDSALAMSSA